MSFVNISNSPSKGWQSNEQFAIHALGQTRVFDLQPPVVPERADASEVKAIAASTVSCGIRDGDAVLVDCAEVDLAYFLIERLKQRGRVTVYTLIGTHSAFRGYRRIA